MLEEKMDGQIFNNVLLSKKMKNKMEKNILKIGTHEAF